MENHLVRLHHEICTQRYWSSCCGILQKFSAPGAKSISEVCPRYWLKIVHKIVDSNILDLADASGGLFYFFDSSVRYLHIFSSAFHRPFPHCYCDQLYRPFSGADPDSHELKACCSTRSAVRERRTRLVFGIACLTWNRRVRHPTDTELSEPCCEQLSDNPSTALGQVLRRIPCEQ